MDAPHNDVLVLTVNVCNYDVKRVLINHGSSAEVMYLNAYNQLRMFIPSKNVQFINTPIYSFSGDHVWPICIIDVLVRIREVATNVKFFLMNIDSPYNALLGQNRLGEMRALACSFH